MHIIHVLATIEPMQRQQDTAVAQVNVDVPPSHRVADKVYMVSFAELHSLGLRWCSRRDRYLH
jgi:hypothetical protein